MSLTALPPRSHDIALSRRRFSPVHAALGGGLVSSLSLPFGQSEAAASGDFVPNSFSASAATARWF